MKKMFDGFYWDEAAFVVLIGVALVCFVLGCILPIIYRNAWLLMIWAVPILCLAFVSGKGWLQ